MELNNKYYIKLTAVTPLSVGAGNEEEWVNGADYVIKDNKVYILDLHRVAEEGIDLNKLSELFLSGNHDRKHEGIANVLGGKIENVAMHVFDLPCSTDNNIKAFERSQMHDLPVVAGSSLKGAIRSVLFNYLRDNEQKNEDVFGTMKEGTDFMRFIKVGDIEMPGTKLFNTKIFNLHGSGDSWSGGWKHALTNGTSSSYKPTGFNTVYECVAPGVSGIGSVMLGKQQFELLLKKVRDIAHEEKKRQIINGDIKELFSIINGFTKNYLLKEKAFFESYPAERTGEVLDCIDKLLRKIPEDDSYGLLKMSAGVGFHAITGDWQYDNYSRTGLHADGKNKGKQKYKSRKIAVTPEGLCLMGFVQLEEVEKEDYEKSISDIRKEYENREIERKRKAEEKAQAAEEAGRIQREIEEKYATLIHEAENLMETECYEDAMVRIQEARTIYPTGKELALFIMKCEALLAQQKVTLEQQRREQEHAQAEAAQASERAEKYGKPLAEVLTYSKYICQEVRKWCSVGNEFGEEEYQTLLEVLKPLDAKQARSALKSLKDMEKAMRRKDLAIRLFKDLGLR